MKRAGLFFILVSVLFVESSFGAKQPWQIIQNCDQLRHVIVSQGWLAPLVYVLVSALSLIVFVPRTLLVIVGGICFGVVWGTIWSLVGSMLSAVLTFVLARRLGRRFVEEFFKKRKWFFKLEKFSHNSGFHLVLMARATHLLNFGALNWLCGVLDLSGVDFAWGTFWGILPGTIILIYSSQVLGCQFWERKFYLSFDLIYLIVITSLFLILPSLVYLKIARKK